MSFSSHHLAASLASFPAGPRRWVAFSGGLDSSVLLHALVRLRDQGGVPLQAVHVNHGLHGDAGQWARHCERACAALAVPCRVLPVAAGPRPGESPEAAARRARYQAIATLIEAGDLVLTGHHQDDQAETLLLHLFRGAGPEGLAAMPRCRPFHGGWLVRPLLAHTRAELRAYAERHRLLWLEDPGNREDRYARNYLRHEVLPALRLRWPGLNAVLARAGALQAEAARVLAEVAAGDLAEVVDPGTSTLAVDRLSALPPARQRQVLRHWLRAASLPVPGLERLEQIRTAVAAAGPAATPLVRWPGAEVRRYRQRLYAQPWSAAADPAVAPEDDWCWDPSQPLLTPHGILAATASRGEGLSRDRVRGARVRVRWRRGGERCRPAARAHGQSLKKLLQERGVPPWLRGRLPLVYVDEALAAVADLWVCAPFAAAPEEPSWRLDWRPRIEQAPVSARQRQVSQE